MNRRYFEADSPLMGSEVKEEVSNLSLRFIYFYFFLFIRTPTGNSPLKGDVASSSEFVTYLRRYSQSLTYRITMRLKAQNVSLKMSARSQWFKKAFATRGKRQNRPDCTVFTRARGSLNSL